MKLKTFFVLGLATFTGLMATAAFAGCGEKYDGTVTFSGNGGTLVSGTEIQTVEEGGNAVAPIYAREGYTLVGWSRSIYNINSSDPIEAIWQPTTLGLEYTLTEDGNAYKLTGLGSADSETTIIPASYYNGKIVIGTTYGTLTDNDVITTLVIPCTWTDVGMAVCRMMNVIHTAIFCEGVTEITQAMFARSESLSQLYIPRSLKTISDSALGLCNVQDIYYAGTEEEWNQVEIVGDMSQEAVDGATIHFESEYSWL